MNLKVSARLTALAAVIFIITGLNVTSFSQQSRPRYNQRSYSGGWTLPPDTIISMRMDQTLKSKTSRVGDRFTATVTAPVQANGRVVIPTGTIVEGRVTQVTPAKRMSKAGTIAIDFDSIIMPDGRRLALVGSLTSDDPEIRRRIDDENSVRGPRSDRKAVFVGGSGAIGAVLGGILGGGKGAVVGGVAGAAVGLAGVLLSKGEEAEVRAGTPFGIQLRQPLSMRGDPNYDNSPGGYNSRDNNSRDNNSPNNNSRAGETRPRPDRDPGPDYDRPGRRETEPRNYPDRKPQPEPGESDPNDVPAEPAREPARDPGAVRRNESTAKPEPAASDPEPEPVPVNLPLSSAEMIRRAQVALRDQGYYEGPLDGVMTPRTSNSLKTYQRENNIPQTGDLDPATADKLGITRATPTTARRETRPSQRQPRPSGGATASDPATADRVVLANVLSATANRIADGSLYILINTQANTGGWRWFGEQVANGDTLEVYARAVKPTGMVTQALTRGRIELTVKDGVDLVRRVVVHGAAGDITIPLGSTSRPSESSGSRAGEPQSSPVSSIQRQAEQLLSDYKRQIGLRSSGSRTEIDSRYGEPEIELLVALESFANAARVYNNLIPGIQDRQSARSATLSLAREARKTDRVITTTSSSLADSVNRGWDGIRLDVLRLIKAHNISSSDLDD